MSREGVEEVRARYRVTGRVQGVGFRWSAAREARRLGLRGWIRNCSDGAVESLVAGSSVDVGRYRDWLEQGPSGARVLAVEELPADDHPLPPSFDIVR